MNDQFRICLLIPTYNNPLTIKDVVQKGRKYLNDIIVVDDGSSEEGRCACATIDREGLAVVHHRAKNGGKGAALKDGFRIARERGFSHVLQADGDGQHDLSLIPRFVAVAQQRPDALVLGAPQYDGSAPGLRMSARKITKFWVDLEVGRGVVEDAMIGFRVYPLGPLSTVHARGNRMSFDIEICVRAAWSGIPILNERVPVKYLSKEEGGVSHFRPFGDNAEFAWLHTRLTTWRFFSRIFGFRCAPPSGPALLAPATGVEAPPYSSDSKAESLP